MRVRLPAVRILTLVLFALLCAIVAYWALQLFAHRAPVAPAGAVAQGQAPIDLAQTSRLFGGVADAAPAAAAPVNIQVTGVVAAGRRGVALLAVDGRPAKPFHVGQQVGDGIKLVAVEPTSVRIDLRGREVELPAPARGSVSVLTSGANRTPGQVSSATTPPVGVGPATAPAANAPQSAADRAPLTPGVLPPGFTVPPGSAGVPGLPGAPGAPGVPGASRSTGASGSPGNPAPPGAVSAPGLPAGQPPQPGMQGVPPADLPGQGAVPTQVNPPDTGAPTPPSDDAGASGGGQQ